MTNVLHFIKTHSLGVLLLLFSPLAAAYIGPGSGISVIGSLLGLLATVFIAFFAIVLFPIRKMRKKRRAAEEGAEAELAEAESAGAVKRESQDNPEISE